ncbi:hypothetical protein [Ktedonospora formicarum]|uniref:DUF4145 domain-containing protein n=1 Tax=Ktedonospora formicarum TaxID=2778364 RepID=A0A8J3ID93_9CHLR|nr:hypothetical protein [Ktedonospora formicarum]GHO49224.1 hypothetical protein KSX_73870 [Ktedonospora formicarum]
MDKTTDSAHKGKRHKLWFKRDWKKALVIILCLMLIAIHSIWPHLAFDSINIWLGLTAIGLFLLPRLDFLFPYMKRIKKFKAWELELELSGLESNVEKAEVENSEAEIPQNISPEVEEVLREAARDPRAALLLLSSKIETTVRMRLEEAQLDLRSGGLILRFPPTNKAIETGIEKGLFPPTALSAYRDFQGIRNKIAHNYTFQVDNATILSLISLGSELLKLLSAKKPDTTG